MNGLKLSIAIRWRTVQTDLSNCLVCNDLIFSDMKQLFVLINSDPQPTDKKVCKSCWEELQNERSAKKRL